MTSWGPSSEQLAWGLSGRTSWRWEPGARQVGQGFGEKMRGGLCVGKDPEGMSLPGMVGLQCVCVCVCVCVRVMKSHHYLRLSLIRNAFEVFLEPYDQVGPLCKDWEEGTLPVREAVTLGKGRTGDLTQENGHFINTLY